MIISGHAAPAVLLHIVCLFMLMKILLSCSHPAPDVALRFVGVKNLSGFTGKGWVNLEEPFGNIFMYRTLTDTELFRCLPHRRTVLYNIIRNLHGSFLNIIFQKNPPANIVFTMYAGGKSLIHILENMIIHNQRRKYNGNHRQELDQNVNGRS